VNFIHIDTTAGSNYIQLAKEVDPIDNLQNAITRGELY